MRTRRVFHPNEQRGDHPIDRLPRNQRRQILDDEARRRKSGDWGPWEAGTLPAGIPGSQPGSWPSDVRGVMRCKIWAVFMRAVPSRFGVPSRAVLHLAVSNVSGIRPTWPELQRIKDELAGEKATAVEVYPPKAEIVDDAQMYHLWVLPGPLPFSLFDRDEARDG